MLRKRDLIAGKFYVNNERRIAREVLQTSRRIIKFITYHLDTGNSSGLPSECPVEDFVRWANSEASPAELAFLDYQGREAQFLEADR